MPGRIEEFEYEEIPDVYDRTTPRERDTKAVSIIERATKSFQMHEMHGRDDDVSRNELESFADRLLRQNAAKQAEPEIVARHVARTSRLLREERDLSSKRFATAHVGLGRARETTPRTIFGTEAWIAYRYFPKTASIGYAPRFVSRLLALPCVERVVRREVMFARKKAGTGYRVPHRRHAYTDIWC